MEFEKRRRMAVAMKSGLLRLSGWKSGICAGIFMKSRENGRRKIEKMDFRDAVWRFAFDGNRFV
jgi:hypothetical protein